MWVSVLPQYSTLSKLYGFLTIKFSVWILSIKCLDFSSLFAISCISDHVQPISKPLSVVLAECGRFVTWSVQEYSCGHLVCAFLHSPVLLCGHIGLDKTKHRNRLGISTFNSLLTVQFNVPQKFYEFKSNTELLKTCVNAMNTL